MKEKCFEIGTIQAFLDGELASDLLENVARHVAVCEGCARLMAEAEEESAFVFSALEQEFNTLVPTQRLWTKINDSIGKERKSVWQNVFAFFSNPTVAAFASLLAVFGLFVAFLSLQNNTPVKSVAEIIPDKQKVIVPIISPDLPIVQSSPNKDLESPQVVVAKQNLNDYRIIKTDFVKKENNPKISNQRKFQPDDLNSTTDSRQPTTDNKLSGEESYIQTIKTLEKTVNSRKDEVLKPSSRFAFEKDLAVVNDAIRRMKAEVEKNPKNEAAKNVLRASYQNKIDLLSSVSEKTELMASLK
ncbi:MAG: hypothetical protein M3Q33_10185 [Acidobacteriota bacterium]|nr:hypothetical protein [Acidobacteriota bacterium]